MPEEKHEEPELVEVMKLATKIDWKGMALILTALLGAGGAVWNKVELAIQNYQQRQTVQVQEATTGGAYEAVATRLDELFMRIEALEQKAKVETHYVPVEEVPPPPVGSMGAGGGAAPEAVAVAEEAADEPAPVEAPEPKPEPVSKRFSKARLPEFEAVQQAAREQGDLEQFIQEVKAK